MAVAHAKGGIVSASAIYLSDLLWLNCTPAIFHFHSQKNSYMEVLIPNVWDCKHSFRTKILKGAIQLKYGHQGGN